MNDSMKTEQEQRRRMNKELILAIILFLGLIATLIFAFWYITSDGYKAEQLAKEKECELYGGDYCTKPSKGECVLDCKKLGGKLWRYKHVGFGSPICVCEINNEVKPIW